MVVELQRHKLYPSILITFIVYGLECVLKHKQIQEKHNINTTSGIANEHMIKLGCCAESNLLTRS